MHIDFGNYCRVAAVIETRIETDEDPEEAQAHAVRMSRSEAKRLHRDRSRFCVPRYVSSRAQHGISTRCTGVLFDAPTDRVLSMAKDRRLEILSRFRGDPIDLGGFKRRSWPGISAEHVQIGLTSYGFELRESLNFIALLNIYRRDGEIYVDGGDRSAIKDLRNKLAFVPAGGGVSGWSQLTQPGTLTAVYFDPSMKERDQETLSVIPPIVAFEDHMLRSIMLAFSRILQDGTLDVDGYAETLGLLLTYELKRLCRQKQSLPFHGGGLGPRQLRRVLGHIDENLKDKITVSDLAGLVELSRFHFVRAFKKSTGMPPHQFIMQRRIERAKDMLADSRLPVTDIAFTAGFNGPAQLTRVFRHIVGVTPTTFRRDLT